MLPSSPLLKAAAGQAIVGHYRWLGWPGPSIRFAGASHALANKAAGAAAAARLGLIDLFDLLMTHGGGRHFLRLGSEGYTSTERLHKCRRLVPAIERQNFGASPYSKMGGWWWWYYTLQILCLGVEFAYTLHIITYT